jgi:O-antigen/teichoic acid export membrane protein
MANQRKNDDGDVKARQGVAGRFGFILGCVAAVAAAALNLYRLPRPWAATSVVLAVLMAALNVPLGIAFGLLGEWLSRPSKKR